MSGKEARRISGESPIADRSLPKTVLAICRDKTVKKAAIPCIRSIFYNFFFRQYRAAFLKNIPVADVDHPLDEKIPFLPQKVGIYLDFTAFWIRTAGQLMHIYPNQKQIAADFIASIGKVYETAAEVYSLCMSTTKRPRYFGNLRFIVIHSFDPHLMCIPSLHVMLVIHTYTKFAGIAESFGLKETLALQREELRRGALAITESVLYIKQHSVNCVAAAMYAMTRFDPALFPEPEAASFALELFAENAEKTVSQEDAAFIREHILSLYRQFLDQGEKAEIWIEPLLAFLRENLRKNEKNRDF
jgi:hypothetical protein